MKTKLSSIFLLLSITVFSQTNRFFFELKSRKDSTQKYRENIMILDVTEENVKFYDKELMDYDSINKAQKGIVENRAHTKTDQLVIRKRNSFKNDWYRDFKEYFLVKTNDEMKWQLLPDTKMYNGYKLQKATTNFGGRNWTAWFCKDVPISEGPYKFRGLPGLIFLLNDSENNFIYKLFNNKKLANTYDTSGFLEYNFNKKPLTVTNEQFNKYVLDFYENPTRIISDNLKNGTAKFQGKEIKSQEELQLIKNSLQKFLKEMFVFVEKDKSPIFK